MRNVCRNSRRGHRAGPAHVKGQLFCIHCGEPMGMLPEVKMDNREPEIRGLLILVGLVLTGIIYAIIANR